MSASGFRIRLGTIALVLYIAVVALATLTPNPIDRPYRHYIDKVLAELHERGLPAWFGYGDVEFLSNVAIFVPIGFLAALLVSRRAWWVLMFLGPVLSGAIELAQLNLLPERYSDVRDVVANSIGTILGAILGLALRMLVAHRDRLVAHDISR